MHPESTRREAKALVRSGRSLNSVSATLGVSRSTIRSWLESEAPVVPQCPAPPSSSPAYAALLGYYLGDGCLSKVSRAYALRVCCDARLPGIVRDVECCLHAVHPTRPIYRVRAPGAIVVQSYWKHWPCLFPQHGPGRKHERELGMTDWQWAIVTDHPADFLRGLFHSDGCRVDNWATKVVAAETKRYRYPRWQFVNASEEILGWCGEALDLLQIRWRRSGRRTVSVSRREDVLRLDALIGLKS